VFFRGAATLTAECGASPGMCLSLYKSMSFQCLTEWQLRSADCGYNFRSLLGALGISSTTGNAGTGRASEAQVEHGCEFAPIATTMRYNNEILSAPCRRKDVSAAAGQNCHPVKATERHTNIRETHTGKPHAFCSRQGLKLRHRTHQNILLSYFQISQSSDYI